MSLCISAAAQNNPYEIDDECYKQYLVVEDLFQKPGYDEANERFLAIAKAKGDTKAETLYYVEHLKGLCSLPGSPENDNKVEEAFQTLKQVSRKFDFRQYYYYAYQLAQNYFYNTGKVSRTYALVQKMQETALKEHDDYGIWTGDKYLASLYIDIDDYVSAKDYILKAIRLYDTTVDPTLKRQSLTRLYCDLSDTYPIGHDSVKVNIDKASLRAKTHLDTLRFRYYQARRAIIDRNVPLYHKHREYCLNDPYLDRVSKSAPMFFSLVDAVFEGTILGKEEEVMSLSLRETKVVANLCELQGYKDFAFGIEKRLVLRLENEISKTNQSRLSELDISMGKAALNADLVSKETQISRISRLLLMLMGVIFIGGLVFSTVYIRSLRKSKRKDMERIRELREANEKARHADAAKTRFVQNMSHEVRTPLNAIVGFSQLLSLPDGTLTEDEKSEFSRHIVNNSQMLTMLLDDILNASSMDNGEYKITYEDSECVNLCQAAMSSAEHRLQPGVTMTLEKDFEGDHTIWTDPRRVQQIIINLLTNACKHTTQGSITLRCSLKDLPGMVSFSVTDTGPGVPEEKAEEIFNRFTKLNNFVQGTGLGLSICREIATRMEGKVYLDTSYKAGGARFVFEIPDKAKPE